MTDLGIHLLVDDELVTVAPRAGLHGLAGGHQVLAHALGWSKQRLTITDAQHVMEVLADHATACIKLVRRHVRDLHQHGRHEVHALDQLEVDVHVERHLAALFNLLLFRCTLVLTLQMQKTSC